MDTQEKLWQKLNEYGEDFLATHEVKKKKPICEGTEKIDTPDDESEKSSVAPTTEIKLGKKKKRRKKKKKNEPGRILQNRPKSTQNTSGAERHIEQMKRELGLEDFKEKLEKKKLEEKLEESLADAKDQKHQPEVIVFHSRREKKEGKERKNKDAKKSVTEEDTGQEVDMKTARYDVHKLGISGAKGEEREDAMRNLLIRLGAKAPKNKYYNYKEFQEMRRKQKEKDDEQKTWDRAVGNKISQEGKDRDLKRKRDKKDICHVDSKVGKFKSGVLFLQKADIDQIKNTKVAR